MSDPFKAEASEMLDVVTSDTEECLDHLIEALEECEVSQGRIDTAQQLQRAILALVAQHDTIATEALAMAIINLNRMR